MKPDKKMVTLFLHSYASQTMTLFIKILFPDEAERKMPAVDAIAIDSRETRVALEHTILQPFPEQKHKLHGALAKVFEPIKEETIPGRHILLEVAEDSIGTGQDWKKAGAAVRQWFNEAKASFVEGWSEHTIPGLPCGTRAYVLCQNIKGYSGPTGVTYVHADMEKHFIQAVRESLASKLSKLVDAEADKRILLFQKEWPVYSHYRLGRVLESIESDFPLLAKVDEIWLADTSLCCRGGRVTFFEVWPRTSVSRLPLWAECP
ncbi:MAG: hypothetical protein WB763_04940 [Terriglobia bacterium]|jgi:hypothetical protein